MSVREAKKSAGKAKKPSGSQKTGRDDEKSGGEPSKPVFTLSRAAGWWKILFMMLPKMLISFPFAGVRSGNDSAAAKLLRLRR